MKFWKLTSATRDEQELVRKIARSKARWRFVAEWLDNLNAIVDSQDRAKLDFVLPNEFLRAVFKKSKLRFYLGRGGWLRSRRHSFWDRALSAIEAFDRFGGDAMEEALERGSFQVIKR